MYHLHSQNNNGEKIRKRSIVNKLPFIFTSKNIVNDFIYTDNNYIYQFRLVDASESIGGSH